MVFNSFEFMAFFAIILLLYYIIPKKWQVGYLLAVSMGYYAYTDLKYTVLLVISILLTYGMGLLIEQDYKNKKQLILVGGIVLSMGALVLFKYYTMIEDILNMVSTWLGGSKLPEFSLIAPLGISFYSFKVVSYLMDVYRGKIKAEKNIVKYALFVSFFPQIISGPIERAYNFLPQMEEGKKFDYDVVKDGFLLFLWGLFKKIVVADRFAILVNQVFDNVADYNTPAYLVAMVFFSVQIYFDFAGYSDMAIGVGRMLGIETIKNFNRPYSAKSIGEFWRRWHMSLSTWFRDYLYIPLGGNRVGQVRWMMNVMIVFVTSGLWHGANWTFLVWGAMHGAYQIIGKYTRSGKDKIMEFVHLRKESVIYQIGSRVINFVLVTYAWMFFRANTMSDAAWITKSLVKPEWEGFDLWNLGMGKEDFCLSILLIIVFIIIEIIQEKIALREWLQKRCLPIRWAVYLVIIFTCILFGIYGDLSAASFIYFQF